MLQEIVNFFWQLVPIRAENNVEREQNNNISVFSANFWERQKKILLLWDTFHKKKHKTCNSIFSSIFIYFFLGCVFVPSGNNAVT